MLMPTWMSEVWIWTAFISAIGLLSLAGIAYVKALKHLKRKRWDDALTAVGLTVAFVATVIAVMSVPDRMASDALDAHRHNCIMYELALQRNANPDLTDVPIDPTWDGLECYPTP